MSIPQRKKFSLSQPVEKVGDLVAVHNLSFEKIRGNIELGGIPAPSIAVTKGEMGHQAFGEITLVFKSDTIDPMLDSRNDVFSAEAYTSRFPDIEVKINDKELKNIAKRIGTSASMLEANEFSNSKEGDQRIYISERIRKSHEFDPYGGFNNFIKHKLKAIYKSSFNNDEEICKKTWKALKKLGLSDENIINITNKSKQSSNNYKIKKQPHKY